MRRPFIVPVLAAYLPIGTLIGCQPGIYSDEEGSPKALTTTKAEGEHIAPLKDGMPDKVEWKKPFRVFADESFYLERTELEQRVIGVLRTSTVREGPNTRDMPLKLVTPFEELSVYAAGIDEHALRQFVGQEVEVIGKRIDLRMEGYGVEIWIGTIANRE